jgi:hypothetical protein
MRLLQGKTADLPRHRASIAYRSDVGERFRTNSVTWNGFAFREIVMHEGGRTDGMPAIFHPVTLIHEAVTHDTLLIMPPVV